MHPTNHPTFNKLPRFLCLLMLLFLVQGVFAQGEWNNWYFGAKAGITFQNGSPPTALLNSNMFSVGGCSVISDSAGQLVFYTNGDVVYNRLHQVMLNGTGLHGYNNNESIVAVPLPGSNTKYYLFANGFLTTPPSPPGTTLEYSIVDMTLDNGLGGILSSFKNIIIQGAELSSGAITAVRHLNNRHIWIIVQTTDSPKRFLSYLLTEGGLRSPVVSYPQQLTTYNSPGRIRVSHNGRKLFCQYVYAEAEYYDFNPSTGIVSSLFSFSIPGQQHIFTAEFSVDNKYIYVFSPNYTSGIHSITQFNAGLTDSTLFMKSGAKVADLNFWGNMRLAPDNKIYITKRRQYVTGIDSLSVIHSPGLPVPLCSYQDNYIPLLGRSCKENLPFFLQRYFAYINHTGYCQGMPVTFEPNTWPPPDSLWWNFGDPASGTANFSNDSTPEHTFSSAGTFTVQMIVRHVDMRYDTATLHLTIEPQPAPNLGPDRTVCENQTVVLDAGFNPQWTYLWTTGATTSSIAVNNSGTYGVTVTSPNSCIGSDSVVLSILPGSTPLPKQIRHN